MAHAESIDLSRDATRLGEEGYPAFRIAVILGLSGILLSGILGVALEDGADRFLGSWLVSLTFWLSLSLGALFFVMLQHVTRSGWSVVVRRLAESVMSPFPLLAIALIPILAGLSHLYGWAHHGDEAHHLEGAKAGWLSPGFFTLRLVFYFVIWVLLSGRLASLSAKQDETGDPALTKSMATLSAPGLLLFAFTIIFAAFDLMMSMDPHWYSTMFGVYYFAGAAVGIFALLPIMAMLTQRSGRLTRAIHDEHYHDLGKQLFGYVVFWAYIAFSQYMLMWYGDIPEETSWYLRRQQNGWEVLSLLLLFGHFVLPFVALMSRVPKRRPKVLAAMGVWILLMHWADLHWLVMPELHPEGFAFHLMDVACLVGLGGLFAAVVLKRLSGRSLIPEKDPRLAESLAFENV
jgi:hypothetical protein